ncbi:MAG: hypothetical protein EA398_02385 [Deltaproteobacteria bacterium]|nr:MAG: hypothetical protein EA398_02385 [Deltaproteobacteria bacterium]
MSRATLAALLLLGALLLFGTSACVEGERTEGTRLQLSLHATGDEAAEPLLPSDLWLVLDHVELLACDAQQLPLSARAGGLLRALFALEGTAEAAHLPPAPHRLLVADVWTLREDGRNASPWHPGTLNPPVRDWCGVRFGFHSALPDTPALLRGMPVGRSLLAHYPALGDAVVSGSLGFDVDLRHESDAPWLPAERLRGGPLHLTLHLDLGPLAASAADGAPDAFALARAILAGTTLVLEADPG